jgi:uroporphyrinogen decarboxylase
MIASILGEAAIPWDAQEADRDALEKAFDQKIRFWYALGYDAFWQAPSLPMPDTQRLSTEGSAPLTKDQRSWVNEGAGVITGWRTFERYPWPQAKHADYHALTYTAQRLPDGMGLLAEVTGVLEPVMELMGYETLALALYDDSGLVQAVFDKIEEIFTPVVQAVVQMDRVIALWIGDDMGFKTGPLVGPDHLRSYVFPIHKRYAEIAHQHGKPYLLHSCGNLEVVMDDLIDEVGIDARHSFEGVIEPVESFANRYGDRIGVIGGLDMDILARGTEEQVRKRTRVILETLSPSGGYVLGSGNSITNYIPPQNFLAMVDEGQRFNART